MTCNIISKCGKDSLMFHSPFSYKDSLFILATQGKKDWWYLMTSYFYYFLSCLGLINTLFSVLLRLVWIKLWAFQFRVLGQF
jgi:hypothetical protein